MIFLFKKVLLDLSNVQYYIKLLFQDKMGFMIELEDEEEKEVKERVLGFFLELLKVKYINK